MIYVYCFVIYYEREVIYYASDEITAGNEQLSINKWMINNDYIKVILITKRRRRGNTTYIFESLKVCHWSCTTKRRSIHDKASCKYKLLY